MANRLELHDELCEILGSKSAYFNPPETVKLKHPCIVYSLAKVDKRNADNRLYKSMRQYELTVIDIDPDSEIPEQLLAHFPMCSLDRTFKSDNLNHWVLRLYY